MKHYLVTLQALVALSIKHLLENRLNAVGNIFAPMLYLLTLILFINIFYTYTDSIFGWTKTETLFLIGLFRISTGIFTLLFLRSLFSISGYTKKGELDMFLTKPINSQFFISFRLIRVFEFINILPGFVILFYAISQMNNLVGWSSWILLSFSTLGGILLFYSLYYAISTLAVWFGQFNSLFDVYDTMREPMSKPFDVLGTRTSFFLTYIIPLGFVVTVPAKVFFGKADWYQVIILWGIAFLFFSFSVWFWNFSLRHYTSASS